MIKKKLPFIVYEITTDCNLNCRYCYNIWKRPDAEFKRLNSYKKAKKTIKQLFKIADVDFITMSGGEPMLSERFLELVMYCRMKNKGVNIITNGNTGSANDYELLGKLGINLIELPLHSDRAEEHDYLTQIHGSFDNVVNSIQQLKKVNVHIVTVIVITKANYKRIKDTLLFTKSMGINQIMLNRFNIGGKGISENHNLNLTLNELREAFTVANEVGAKEGLTLTSNVCTPFCILNPDDFPNIKMSSCAANVINMPLTLDIQGNLRLCNHSPVVVGNIYTDSLDVLFNSNYAQEWKEIIPKECSGCSDYPKCLGGCRAASEQIGLKLSNADPIIKQYSQENK
jgi:radical SAM protein with 4Fe4S-binding SPASM domain